MNRTEFVYVTYIKTTQEQLWQALTDSAFTRRYWGVELESDWKVDSPMLTQAVPGGQLRDLEMVVLESEPPRRLSYSWHNYQPAPGCVCLVAGRKKILKASFGV